MNESCLSRGDNGEPVQVISPGTGVREMEFKKVNTQERVPSGGHRREPQRSDS